MSCKLFFWFQNIQIFSGSFLAFVYHHWGYLAAPAWHCNSTVYHWSPQKRIQGISETTGSNPFPLQPVERLHSFQMSLYNSSPISTGTVQSLNEKPIIYPLSVLNHGVQAILFIFSQALLLSVAFLLKITKWKITPSYLSLLSSLSSLLPFSWENITEPACRKIKIKLKHSCSLLSSKWHFSLLGHHPSWKIYCNTFSIPVCITIHSSSFGEERAPSREGVCFLHVAQILTLLAKIQKWHWNRIVSVAGCSWGVGEGRQGKSALSPIRQVVVWLA